MRSKFITDPQGPFDDYLDTVGDEFFVPASRVAQHGPTTGQDAGDPLSGTSVKTLEAYISSDAAATAGTSANSVVAVTSGGITINLLFDAAAMAAPASFRAGIQQAVSLLTAAISDPITVNIKIDYSGTGGGAAAGPDSGLYESYSWTKANLVNHATPGDPTFNALPGGTSVQGQSNVAVWNAQLKLWGVLGANDTTTDDGGATFATDINPNLLVGVALHELTHALGRVPYGSAPDIFDLFRFTSPGSQLFSGGNTAPAAYFSLDGGNTKLADFGQNSDPSDFLNSGVQGPNDPFNEFYTGATSQTLTAVDKQLLDALGFHTITPVTTVIESFGSTSLVQAGSNYFFNPVAGGAGPELKYNGSPVVVGQFNPYVPVAVEQTAGGYEVALKNAGTNQFSIWSTDSNANFLSYTVYSGASTALDALEPSFHQDLNGDGVIGVPTAVIESFGSTSLVQVGNNYFLNAVGGGTGPELKYGGAPVTVGQFDPYVPVAVEQTAGGYEVALKNAGVNQFSIWSTDSNANFISYTVYSGASTALESLETSFHQDLNGDGVIGVVTTVIESSGSTSLVQTGSNYFFNAVGGGTGPELKYGGAPVTVGQFDPYVPVAVEQTAGGYEVALKDAGTNQFSIWSTDSNANFLSYSVYSGASPELETLETSFHQDLNGDGVIGIKGSVIESLGSTSLIQVGQNYFLDSISSGTGTSLKYGGADVVVGQFDPYVPVGVEQTAGGYQVALENFSTHQFSIWNTDSNGNFLSYSVYSGTSPELETLETSFHQDLNGDGVIGVVQLTGTVIESFGSTSLVQVGQNYFLDSISSGTGTSLKYGGADVVVGQFDPYVPVGVEQTTGGYEVALKNAGTNQFSIWNTDNNGNFLSYSVYSGTSPELETLETSFHQDLNGDGVIGVPAGQAAPTALTLVSHTALFSPASQDTFLFRPDLGAGLVANTVSAVGAGPSEPSLSVGQDAAALWNDGQIFHWSSPPAAEGHVLSTNLANPDYSNWATAAELHTNHFIIV